MHTKEKAIKKLYKTKSKAEINEIFQKDLKDRNLKYFSFGFGSPEEKQVKYLKAEYKIKTYTMGCSIEEEPLYYNYLLSQYLINKHNDSTLGFYYKLNISTSSEPLPHQSL